MLIGYANYMMPGVLIMCVQYTSILITIGFSGLHPTCYFRNYLKK